MFTSTGVNKNVFLFLLLVPRLEISLHQLTPSRILQYYQVVIYGTVEYRILNQPLVRSIIDEALCHTPSNLHEFTDCIKFVTIANQRQRSLQASSTPRQNLPDQPAGCDAAFRCRRETG